MFALRKECVPVECNCDYHRLSQSDYMNWSYVSCQQEVNQEDIKLCEVCSDLNNNV